MGNVFAINAGGEVSGWGESSLGSLYPASCSGNVQTVIPAGMIPGSSGNALGINTSGQIVGEIANQAFLYSGGTTSAIDPFSTSGFSNAYGINDSGQIVGNYGTMGGGSDAYLYSGGVFTDLNTLTGFASPGIGTSYAYAINDNGQIVGQSAGDAAYGAGFAYLDSGGVITPITPSASCTGGSTATAINSTGQVVGSYRVCGSDTGVTHAFLYSGGDTTDLGVLGDAGASSFANGINDSGEVVGYSEFIPGDDRNNSGDFDAFLYSNGVMIDLTSLLPANSGFTRLLDAVAINNSGQIIGVGLTTTGGTDSFLLDTGAAPTPEPGSLALLGAGLTIVALRSCRTKIPPSKV